MIILGINAYHGDVSASRNPRANLWRKAFFTLRNQPS
jgi:hypothetical protein